MQEVLQDRSLSLFVAIRLQMSSTFCGQQSIAAVAAVQVTCLNRGFAAHVSMSSRLQTLLCSCLQVSALRRVMEAPQQVQAPGLQALLLPQVVAVVSA